MKKSLGALSLAFTTPVWVIGTYDAEGKANVMTASWGGICCSRPPCVNVSLRKATYSYQNIVNRQSFTVNIPSVKHVKEADYFGLASGRDVDKIETSGFTVVKSDIVDAPYIQDFLVTLECSLIHTHEIDLHTLFVGEIKDVKADASVITDDGNIDVEKLQPFVYGPKINTYHALGSRVGTAFEDGREMIK